MKNYLQKTFAAALISAFALSLSVPAYAHGHGTSHHEETLCGWTTVDGKQYYYNSSGSCVKKSCVIDGVRYKFGSDGVCKGAYTGWVNSGGKYFYYKDGLKQCGWTTVEWKNGGKVIGGEWHNGDWYYIDPEKGRLTGKQKIDGKTYKFDEKGRWDKDGTFKDKDGKNVSNYQVAVKVMEEMNRNDHGGVYLCNGMCVIWSVDGRAEKVIGEWYPDAKCVIYKKANYSAKELESAQNCFDAKESKSLWSAVGRLDSENIIIAESLGPENLEALQKFVDTLPCKDMIKVIEGGVIDVD